MSSPPDPPVQNPIRGSTVDTSPGSLGLDQSGSSTDTAPSGSTRNRTPSLPLPRNVIRRVEQTAAKIGSTVLGTTSNSNTNSRREAGAATQREKEKQPHMHSSSGDSSNSGRLTMSLNPASPRRFLSLNRKGKEREHGGGSADGSQSSPPRPEMPNIRRSMSAAYDDSPFVQPPSPPMPSIGLSSYEQRPSLQAFSSMRAGTQTLIQAIQAIPWADEPENDDEASPPTAVNTDSSDEEEEQGGAPLASSIHTIHRPIARSRKHEQPGRFRRRDGTSTPGYFSPIQSSDEEDSLSAEGEDFEPTPVISQRSQHIVEVPMNEETTAVTTRPSASVEFDRFAHLRKSLTRNASLATVRIKRRTRLADKLKDIFGLSEIKEVIAELPCWLLRSILLQGYMYLTNSHLCFFAHLPSREDQVLKSGSLTKKTQRTKRWIKHWFVLKNDVLSWYQSSSDPYFPHGVVDLRYAMSCDPIHEKSFRIRTNQKTITIMADSIPSRDEWVKAVRKVIFKAQNVGESVKIAIPYSVVVDVDKSSAMDFSETIEVKVIDQEDKSSSQAYDSYFFAYFHNISTALDQIRDAIKTYKPLVQPATGVSEVFDTTQAATSGLGITERPVLALTEQNKGGYASKLTSLLRPFQSETPTNNSSPTQSNVPLKSTPERHSVRQESSPTLLASALRSPPKAYLGLQHPNSVAGAEIKQRSMSEGAPGTFKTAEFVHSYPPPPSPPTELVQVPTRDSIASTSSWGVPSWLKSPRRAFGSLPPSISSSLTIGPKAVSEVISSGNPAGDRSITDFGFSVLETRDAAEPEIIDKFRSTFAFDDKEHLLGYFPGYLFRLLPAYGRLFVSTNFFCFKSSGPLATRTRMQLPIKDIMALEKTKAYRFGHVGLVVIVKGHEELFFEFGSADRREAFVRLLEKQMEEIQNAIANGEPQAKEASEREALMLDELEPAALFGDEALNTPSDATTDDLPAVMFTSASSTFLTFKPRRPLHFTCLTIGSRGDVQPYIALAKGLMAEGHTVRIATHGEFKEWIESHGIEFGYVGGDPAELMRICVENGMFTVSFLKEGIQKFRGWIDDLLKTSWEACQGTDILIESPSAMAGIHIAEALRIPYYRAFTMTWTRTRAYPHAFAVPEHKMGGGYNYMSYVMFDQVFWRATSGQINRWRRNTLRISGTNLDKMEPHKVPFLYNFSPTVVPPPLDWPEWIRVTGYWFLDDADVSANKWTPPSDLVSFIDNAHLHGKKVVYIGFGSIVVSDPEAMTRCVIEAIVQSGVHAILSKGWSDRLQAKKDASEPEAPLPPQIYSVKSVPHDWLFQRIEAACHHGGAGTTGASLRAGIPTIIKPFFGDQFFWGDRVEALGIGTCVRKLTVDSLADALILATTDEKQIAKAKLVGEKIRSENGVATAIESIYRDLEYARTLIKTSRSAPDDGEEDATIRDNQRARSSTFSTTFSSPHSLSESLVEGQENSEDWSVISDNDDRKSRRSSRQSTDLRQSPNKDKEKKGLVSTVMSVLPSRS